MAMKTVSKNSDSKNNTHRYDNVSLLPAAVLIEMEGRSISAMSTSFILLEDFIHHPSIFSKVVSFKRLVILVFLLVILGSIQQLQMPAKDQLTQLQLQQQQQIGLEQFQLLEHYLSSGTNSGSSSVALSPLYSTMVISPKQISEDAQKYAPLNYMKSMDSINVDFGKFEKFINKQIADRYENYFVNSTEQFNSIQTRIYNIARLKLQIELKNIYKIIADSQREKLKTNIGVYLSNLKTKQKISCLLTVPNGHCCEGIYQKVETLRVKRQTPGRQCGEAHQEVLIIDDTEGK
jgi:hypothetical protein